MKAYLASLMVGFVRVRSIILYHVFSPHRRYAITLTRASPLHVYVLSLLYYDVFPLRFSRCFARCAARFLFRSTVPTPA